MAIYFANTFFHKFREGPLAYASGEGPCYRYEEENKQNWNYL